jgi:hypothetical protein
MMDAMMLNPGDGPDWGLIVLAIAATGLIVGFAWVRRIAKLGDDPDRSFFRYRRRR